MALLIFKISSFKQEQYYWSNIILLNENNFTDSDNFLLKNRIRNDNPSSALQPIQQQFYITTNSYMNPNK